MKRENGRFDFELCTPDAIRAMKNAAEVLALADDLAQCAEEIASQLELPSEDQTDQWERRARNSFAVHRGREKVARAHHRALLRGGGQVKTVDEVQLAKLASAKRALEQATARKAAALEAIARQEKRKLAAVDRERTVLDKMPFERAFRQCAREALSAKDFETICNLAALLVQEWQEIRVKEVEARLAPAALPAPAQTADAEV